MKVFVLASALFILWQATSQLENPENPVEVPTTTSAAQPTLNLKEKCLLEIQDNDTFSELEYNIVSVENNSYYGAYLSCYWKNKHLLNENGAINFIELEKLIESSVKMSIDLSDVPLLNTWPIATRIVDECKNVQGKTHGQKAVRMRNCMFGKLLRQRNAQVGWDFFEDIPNLDLTEENCVNELKLDGLEIEDINRHYMVPENNTQFGEFLACFWKKTDMMDQNGNFNISVISAKLNEAVESEILARSRVVYLSNVITESIIEGCREIKGSSDGELVLKVQSYILERMPYFKIFI